MTPFSQLKTYDIANAKFLLAPEDLVTAQEVWDQQVYQFLPKRGMKILDIGANKGIFAVYCGLMGASVVAYEPEPENFRCLNMNVEMNKVDVLTMNAGAWYVTERKTLALSESSGGHSLFRKGRYAVDCDFVDFNDIIAQCPIWDVVKIDCEGAEFEILIHATDESLRKIKYLAVEVHDYRDAKLYFKMVERLEQFFTISGVKEASGRWNYIYATALPSSGAGV